MSKLLGIVAVVAILLFFVMTASGPGSRMSNGWQYLTTGNTTQQSGLPAANANGSTDYRALARLDASDNGLNSDSFERQINQESGFDPNAVSSMGAIGIAQIMPATAKAWAVDPHDPVASLAEAAKVMAWYQGHYGSWEKALAAYNGGSSKLNYCIANYSDWLSCMPAETQRYIAAIGG